MYLEKDSEVRKVTVFIDCKLQIPTGIAEYHVAAIINKESRPSPLAEHRMKEDTPAAGNYFLEFSLNLLIYNVKGVEIQSFADVMWSIIESHRLNVMILTETGTGNELGEQLGDQFGYLMMDSIPPIRNVGGVWILMDPKTVNGYVKKKNVSQLNVHLSGVERNAYARYA